MKKIITSVLALVLFSNNLVYAETRQQTTELTSAYGDFLELLGPNPSKRDIAKTTAILAAIGSDNPKLDRLAFKFNKKDVEDRRVLRHTLMSEADPVLAFSNLGYSEKTNLSNEEILALLKLADHFAGSSKILAKEIKKQIKISANVINLSLDPSKLNKKNQRIIDRYEAENIDSDFSKMLVEQIENAENIEEKIAEEAAAEEEVVVPAEVSEEESVEVESSNDDGGVVSAPVEEETSSEENVVEEESVVEEEVVQAPVSDEEEIVTESSQEEEVVEAVEEEGNSSSESSNNSSGATAGNNDPEANPDGYNTEGKVSEEELNQQIAAMEHEVRETLFLMHALIAAESSELAATARATPNLKTARAACEEIQVWVTREAADRLQALLDQVSLVLDKLTALIDTLYSFKTQFEATVEKANNFWALWGHSYQPTDYDSYNYLLTVIAQLEMSAGFLTMKKDDLELALKLFETCIRSRLTRDHLLEKLEGYKEDLQYLQELLETIEDVEERSDIEQDIADTEMRIMDIEVQLSLNPPVS